MLHRVRGHREHETDETSVWAAVWDLDAPGPSTTLFRLEDDPQYAGVVLSRDGRIMYHDRSTHDPRPEGRHVPRGGGAGQARADGDEPRRAAPGRHGAGGRAGAARRPDRRAGAPAPGQRSDLVHRVLRRRQQGRDGVVPDQEAIVWSVATGRQLARLPLGESGESLDLSPDGSTLYTAGSGSSLRHWDLDGDRRFLSQVAASKPEAPEHLWGTWRSPHPVASSSRSPPGKRSCSSTSPPGPPATVSIGGPATPAMARGIPTVSASPSPPAVRSGSGTRDGASSSHVRDPRAATSAASTTAPTAPAW